MSGPKTASYTLADAVLDRLLEIELQEEMDREEEKARAAEAARQAAKAERRAAEARARAEKARLLEEKRLAELNAVRVIRRQLVMKSDHLASLLTDQPTTLGKPNLPDVPEIDDETMQGLTAMRARFAPIEQRLIEVASLVDMAHTLSAINLSGVGEGQSVDQMLDSFVAERREPAHRDTSVETLSPMHKRQVIDRILGKMREVSVDELPVALESLLQRILTVEGNARFDMLSTELRLQVQQHNDRVEQRLVGSRSASQWLERLNPLDVASNFAELRETLSDVAAGRQPWDLALQAQCDSAMKDLEVMLQRRKDASAAHILELTLRDLGYEVEGIKETLFSEGGTVFFQNQGWGEHHMRLRVLPDRDMLHFNMVRPSNASTSRELDHEMEQLWCTQYPKLMAALAARGVNAAPLRAIKAGSMEVESVDSALLPKRSNKSMHAANSLEKQARQASNKS